MSYVPNMAGRTALMQELGALWMAYVGQDHHKDRDCHFVIEQYFSYGLPPYWTAFHNGYCDDGFGSYPRESGERRFATYDETLTYCIQETLEMFRRHYDDLPDSTVARLKQLSAQVDTRRMAETGTGSVRSTGSAVPEGNAP